ncbi:hypothetical protein [Blautia sp.]|uniref:hypothetical protein n=1 Tax=Blautia sp. TaxID=1955243 RepID=UPI00257E7CBF|nr:hypothetical protein [Blautia sp.]
MSLDLINKIKKYKTEFMKFIKNKNINDVKFKEVNYVKIKNYDDYELLRNKIKETINGDYINARIEIENMINQATTEKEVSLSIGFPVITMIIGATVGLAISMDTNSEWSNFIKLVVYLIYILSVAIGIYNKTNSICKYYDEKIVFYTTIKRIIDEKNI